ncbi:MAG: cytochrome c1 [Chromatiales bacterium]
MRRLTTLLVALLWSGAVPAAGGHALYEVDIDLGDKASLQRGAQTFVNYCLSCHSASYARYSRLAEDLEIPEEVVTANMMFVTDKVGNTMNVAMRKDDAENWFGVPPPDLSVIARSRGADWLYTFLLTFYLDPARPTGVNNLAFKDTAMPHVLWELQGLQRPVVDDGSESHSKGTGQISRTELATPGRLTETAYRQTVRDLVNFLVYLGEPARLVRYRVGFWAMLFLIGFFCLAYQLKKEYWKDVH